MPGILRGAGLSVIAHGDRFKHDAPDTEWLRVAGRSGWVVLTKDRLREDPLERRVLALAGVRCFMIRPGPFATGKDSAQLFLDHRTGIESTLEKHGPPFLAAVSIGRIEMIQLEDFRPMARPVEADPDDDD